MGQIENKAAREIEDLARRGSIKSILLLADALRDGWMYEKDLAAAEAWYGVAAESGSAHGAWGLGLTHLLMGRFDDAVPELETVAARDYPPALNTLAGVYARGTEFRLIYERHSTCGGGEHPLATYLLGDILCSILCKED